MQRDVRARMYACKREYVRGCVQRAREMCTTTIQILLLLLREQSPVNRLPRHNVSIQVRSGVLNRSAPLRSRFTKNPRERTELSRFSKDPTSSLGFAVDSRFSFLSIKRIRSVANWIERIPKLADDYALRFR